MTSRGVVLAWLLAVASLGGSGEADAACTPAGNRAYCDSVGEAQSQAQANCAAEWPFVFKDVQRNVVANVTWNGAEYEGLYYARLMYYADAENVGNCPGTGGVVNYFGRVGGPSLDCEALNDEFPPGEQLFEEGTTPSRCVGSPNGGAGEGCMLVAADASPTSSTPGSSGGQATTWNSWQMTYSGETCDPGTVDQDDFFNEDPTTPDRQCNVDLGVCVNADGTTDYCSFNPDGTPSACVPAQDYDNDGIDDGDDSDPTTPEDMDDDGTGDETDNTASGGATCEQPPTCKGDGIQCAMLLQQWRTRCAVMGEGQLLANTACDSAYELKCTGISTADCYALHYAKKTACAAGAEGGDYAGAEAEVAGLNAAYTGPDGTEDIGAPSAHTSPTPISSVPSGPV